MRRRLTGTVALAPPPAPVVAAPVVAVRPAPAPRYIAPPAEIVVADEGEAAADEGEIDSEIAEAGMPEAAPDDGQEVAEAADVAGEEVAVVQFVSEEPVIRGDGGASIAMLRHELSVRERKPEPEAVVEAVVDEPPAPAADEEPGPADEGAPAEPEATEPEADEPVGEAGPISSEELLAQAESVTTEVLDHGSNNEQSLGVVEHVLVARPAGPPKAAESEGEEPGPEPEAAPAAVAPEADEANVAEAGDDGGESAEDEPVGSADQERPDVARADEEPAVEEEPEQ